VKISETSISAFIIIIIIIIIIIGKSNISFMHCVYTYVPEKNHVPKEYIVAAILSLLFMVSISMAAAWGTFPSAFSEVCVQFQIPQLSVVP
jgi:hypothetical protein